VLGLLGWQLFLDCCLDHFNNIIVIFGWRNIDWAKLPPLVAIEGVGTSHDIGPNASCFEALEIP